MYYVYSICEEMEVEVPVLPSAPHDSSNQMNTENAVMDLPLLVWSIERDLSEDMEEFDNGEGNNEENKETNIMSSLLVAMTELQ